MSGQQGGRTGRCEEQVLSFLRRAHGSEGLGRRGVGRERQPALLRWQLRHSATANQRRNRRPHVPGSSFQQQRKVQPPRWGAEPIPNGGQATTVQGAQRTAHGAAQRDQGSWPEAAREVSDRWTQRRMCPRRRRGAANPAEGCSSGEGCAPSSGPCSPWSTTLPTR
jgi:hypothetical protein